MVVCGTEAVEAAMARVRLRLAPKEEAVAHLRISVAGMMILLLGLGLALASFRFPSEAAAAAVVLATQATLAFAILAVVYREGSAGRSGLVSRFRLGLHGAHLGVVVGTGRGPA